MTVLTLCIAISSIVTSSAFVFWDPADKYPTLNTYFSNSFINESFFKLKDDFPDLVQVTSLGGTPLHNKIYEITITSDVDNWKTANKPNVKYVGNMHGNEVRGRGLLLKLAYYLTANYSTDSDVKDIVDNTVFHLIPTINPDGFDKAEYSCNGVTGRYTSTGTDMNRDFPSHWQSGTKLKFADETKLVMSYADKVPAVLGISFHDGSLVTNYPWDGVHYKNSGQYAASPDDHEFIAISKAYALNHKTMANPARQCNLNEFPDGITNGNEWYKVFNGMQDWNYWYNDCFEVTIELGCCKYPTDGNATFRDVWSDNFDSIFAFTATAHYGVTGRVTDYNGNPIKGAKISVSGNDKVIKVRHEGGYYWRPLVAGKYNITASKHGYYTYTRRNISVLDKESTDVNFILISKSQVRTRQRKRSG